MIYSIHIPKTAGTSFAQALSQRFGKKLALYYGKDDVKTTDCLRVDRADLLGPVSELADRGFEALHGHYNFRNVAPLVKDRRQVWTWLRDPVARTLSQFNYFSERPELNRSLADRVRDGEIALDDFIRIRNARDVQSRFLAGVELSELGFVGVTEHFELGLALLFDQETPTLRRRYNSTEGEVAATKEQREKIVKANAADVQLYAEGLRLFVGRLAEAKNVTAAPKPVAGDTLVKRLRRRFRPRPPRASK